MCVLTRFLNCLWMASNASLMVTPFMFRATTSRPSGKCRVIDLSLGSVSGSFSTDGSSTVLGDLFSFLESHLLARVQTKKAGQSYPDHGGPVDNSAEQLLESDRERLSHQLSFCVSIEMSMCLPSFSVARSAQLAPHSTPPHRSPISGAHT